MDSKPPTPSSSHHGYHLFGRFDVLPGSSTSPMPKIIFRGAGFRLPHMPAVLRMAMLRAESCKCRFNHNWCHTLKCMVAFCAVVLV